jgi:hypothetical protein
MFFSSWLWNRASNRAPRARASHPAAAPRFRPRLEGLEDRWLPSTLTVTNPLDDGSSGTLRATIAAAASGDTIAFDGSLNGQTIALNGSELLIDKDLNIQGPGADQLAISGNQLSRVFEVGAGPAGSYATRPHVSLSDLTIRDGKASSLLTGIYNFGGGIYNYATLTLSCCTLSGNSARVSGGAILNYYTGTLTLSGCKFFDNSAGKGGGGIFTWDGPIAASDCIFSGNSSDWSGGAIYKNNGSLSLTGCTFSGNSARSGGAIADAGSSASTLNVSGGCTLTGNSAWGGVGGGIWNSNSMFTVSGSTFFGNSSVSFNGQGGAGGGIYSAGPLTLSSTTISNNAASVSGGGIYSVPLVSYALTVSGCTISGNTADVVGGIFYAVYSTYAKNATLTITGSMITGNTASTKGGGLYNNGAATLQNTTITKNSAGAQGGGIFNDSAGTLTLYASTTLTGNFAPEGADLYNLGRVNKKK